MHRAGLADDDPAVVRSRSTLQTLPPAELRTYAFSDWSLRTEMPPRARDVEDVVDRADPVAGATSSPASKSACTSGRIGK